jgi:hypothetical protein
MGVVARPCQPSTLRMLIWPEASGAQNNMAAVSADGSTVCVLILRSCSRSIALVVRALFHWLGGRRTKAKRLSLTIPQRRQPRCHHRPLAFVEIPAFQVLRDHERQWVDAIIEWLRMATKYLFIGQPNLDQRAVRVPAIEDLVLMHDDLVGEAMLANVIDERLELSALNKREDIRQRVKRDHRHYPRGDCDMGRVVISAMASIRITPVIDGVTTKPMSLTFSSKSFDMSTPLPLDSIVLPSNA